jgi:hypothetical protein
MVNVYGPLAGIALPTLAMAAMAAMVQMVAGAVMAAGVGMVQV